MVGKVKLRENDEKLGIKELGPCILVGCILVCDYSMQWHTLGVWYSSKLHVTILFMTFKITQSHDFQIMQPTPKVLILEV